MNMKRLPLTKAQEKVWGVLLGWASDYGDDTSPTRREIAEKIGVSKQWVDLCLKELERKKYIHFLRGRYRNIAIIKLREHA